MQHSDNFDYSGLRDAIINDVNWFCGLRPWNIATRMRDMKTSDVFKNVSPVAGSRAFWIGRNPAHRRSDKRGITAPAFNALPLIT